MPATEIFWPSPRLKEALPGQSVKLPAPPQDDREARSLAPVASALALAGMTVGGMAAVGAATGNTSMLAFSAPMMLISSLGSGVIFYYERRRASERTALKNRWYLRTQLPQVRRDLAALRERQQRIRSRNDPSLADCLRIAVHREPELWARSATDDDFLRVRVGLGTLPSTVTLEAPADNVTWENADRGRSVEALKQEFGEVPNVPVTFSLIAEGVTGLTGERSLVLAAAASLVTHIATHHKPSEVKLAGIFPAEEIDQWAWLRWLPHAWDEQRSYRFLAIDSEREMTRRLLAALEDIMDRRQLTARENAQQKRFFPLIVVLLASQKTLENEPLVGRLQTEGPGLGVLPVFLPETNALPAGCRASVRLEKGGGELVLRRQGGDDRYALSPADLSPAADAAAFARSLASLRLGGWSTKGIPDRVALLELLDARTVAELNVAEQWTGSLCSSKSISAPLGIRRGGEKLTIDLHESAHGPNGLVAGMVGAGKSEALQTLVASLAVKYHPHQVAFALVDYKGGGMSDPFKDLPHCWGAITNLKEGNLAARALLSLTVELQRRLRLFSAVGVNKIDDYQKLYYEGKVKEALPFLVIIVDEFAEMKTEQPDIAKEFVRIARLGRAPGLCLILAMQKPAGIVDGQIEGNTRFRLCLRVASTEDSHAMLKRPDAAYLTRTGRAYLQVGANELFEEFQVAFAGAAYDPDGLQGQDPLEVREVTFDGLTARSFSPRKEHPAADPDEQELTQLTALLDHIEAEARRKGVNRLRQLWCEPLPEHLLLDTVRPARGWDGRRWRGGGHWLEPVVGQLDNVQEQKQPPAVISFPTDGHLLVYGAPGSGKSVFVQTLITSLALDHSPEDVNFYVVDCGGRLLKTLFGALPHMGSVVEGDETERVHRLFDFILARIEERRALFAEKGAQKLRDYRSASGPSLPALFLVIDNYANFCALYDDLVETVVALARDAAPFGIYLVITANTPSVARVQLTSNISNTIALQMVDRGDYDQAVGATEGLTPGRASGRGLWRGQPVLEVQVALPVDGANDGARTAALKQLAASMAGAPWAPKIEIMPRQISLHELLLPGKTVRPPATGAALTVPLGRCCADLTPLTVDLTHGPTFLITGAPRSGKTSLLGSWLLALAEQNSCEGLSLYIFDSMRRGLKALAQLPHTCKYCGSPDAAAEGLLKLHVQIQERRELYARAGDNRPDFPPLVIAYDDLFDRINDCLQGQDDARRLLGDISRLATGLNVYLLVTAPYEDLRGSTWNETVRSLKSSQTGALIGFSGDDEVFSLHLPPQESGRMLPKGEAYWVTQGQHTRVKLASAWLGAPSVEAWVEEIMRREAAPAGRPLMAEASL